MQNDSKWKMPEDISEMCREILVDCFDEVVNKLAHGTESENRRQTSDHREAADYVLNFVHQMVMN